MSVQFMRTLSKTTVRSLYLNFCRYNQTKEESKSKRMKVAVLGANGGIGQPLCLMLKQSPLIEELAIYDIVTTQGVALDISHVDTKCKVEAFSGPKELGDTLTDAKVVIITAGIARQPGMTREDLFEKNAGIIKCVAESCVKYCPSGLIGIVTNPVNSLVPVVCEVFKSSGIDNTQRVFGITALDSVRANTFVAEIAKLKPEDVIVPVIGGHSDRTIVPMFSQARPTVELTEEQIKKLSVAVRQAGTEVMNAKKGKGSATLSIAFAAARFTIALVKGLLGEENIIECAYVHSKICKEVDYFATPVVLGAGGIQKNLGLPKLSDFELCLLQSAIPILCEDIRKGVTFVRGNENEGNICSQYLETVEQKEAHSKSQDMCNK